MNFISYSTIFGNKLLYSPFKFKAIEQKNSNDYEIKKRQVSFS